MTARSRPTGRERPPIRIAAALTGCLVLGAAACGGDSEPAPTTDRPPATTAGTAAPGTTAGTTAVSDEEAAVLETVERYWETWLAANNPPNPDHPDLERYSTGANLEKQRSSIEEHRAQGITFKVPENSVFGHDLEVVGIDATTASVIDCLHDDWVQVNTATGAIVNDEVVTRELVMTLVREDGQWKVQENRGEGKWDGIVECS